MVSRRLGIRPSSHPRPRLLRSWKRQGLHIPSFHHRLGSQRRHRIILKDSRHEELVDDQIQKRFRIHQKRSGVHNDKILKHQRTHWWRQVFSLSRQQTYILISEILIIKIFSGQCDPVNGILFDRLFEKLVSQVILRKQPFLFIGIHGLLQAGKRQEYKRDIFGRQLLFRQELRQLQILRILQVIFK